WDARTGREIRSFSGDGCVAFSPDGTTLATGGPGNVVLILDVATGQVLQRLAGHVGFVEAAVFSAQGDLLATADARGMVRLWRVRPGGLAAATTSLVGILAAPSQSPWLASGAEAAGRSRPVTPLASPPAGATSGPCLGFSPDGRRL